jgi:hypothetical protein
VTKVGDTTVPLTKVGAAGKNFTGTMAELVYGDESGAAPKPTAATWKM